MLAAERIARRDQPALGLFVEDDEIFGWRNADDDFVQLTPFVVGAEVHAQTRA
jgi:hypothetical protein